MSEVRYVYICAARRSGSTFFDLLLGGHSQIASLGEFSFLGKALSLDQTCGCGSPLRSCSTWAKVFDRIAEERGVDLRQTPYAMQQWDTRAVRQVDRKQQTPAYLLASTLRSKWMSLRTGAPKIGPLQLPMPASLRKGVANSFYLYDLIRESWGCQVVVDSSKNIFKALSLYEQDSEHVRILWLTRDGRGVFHSRLKTGLSRKESIGPWMRYHHLAQKRLKQALAPGHLKTLRYEDLATDTGSTLREICEFLGLPFEPQMVDLSKGVRHVVNGNHKATFSRAQGVCLDERWRQGLSASELAFFERKGGSLNNRLGYGPQKAGSGNTVTTTN